MSEIYVNQLELSPRDLKELHVYNDYALHRVVYSLFEDKAMLITQAMDEDLLELTRVMTSAAQAHLTPADRIRGIARAYIQFGITHPAEYAFVFMQQRPHTPNESARVQHGDPGQDPYAFGRSLWEDLAKAGQVSAQDVDLDLMTQIFWEGIHGLTARHLVMGPDDVWFPEVPSDRHIDLMIEVLLGGIVQQFKP